MTVIGLSSWGQQNISPIRKKEHTTGKGNYRPITGLPPISKVFEESLCDESSAYMKD